MAVAVCSSGIRAWPRFTNMSPRIRTSRRKICIWETISLECSRAGASAVALWATMQRFPLVPGGEFAQGLERGRRAALQLHAWLAARDEFVPIIDPELDIVVWGVRAPSATQSSDASNRIFATAADANMPLGADQTRPQLCRTARHRRHVGRPPSDLSACMCDEAGASCVDAADHRGTRAGDGSLLRG